MPTMMPNDAWLVIPQVAIGPIRLGATRESIITLLDGKHREVKRFPLSDNIVLVFDKEGTHVTIDPRGVVVGIAVFFPRAVLLNGVQLLGKRLLETSVALRKAGVRVEELDVGLKCPDVGIALIEAESIIDGVEMYAEGV